MTGRKLRETRLRLGLTQKELGEQLGVKTNTIWRWEKGRLAVPKIATLAVEALAAKLSKPRAPR